MTEQSRTLARLAREESWDARSRISAVGMPLETPESNRACVNNTDAPHVDSQGIEGAHERRSVPDASFNASTPEAYEGYAPDDPLYQVEQDRKAGIDPHMQYRVPGLER